MHVRNVSSSFLTSCAEPELASRAPRFDKLGALAWKIAAVCVFDVGAAEGLIFKDYVHTFVCCQLSKYHGWWLAGCSRCPDCLHHFFILQRQKLEPAHAGFQAASSRSRLALLLLLLFVSGGHCQLSDDCYYK